MNILTSVLEAVNWVIKARTVLEAAKEIEHVVRDNNLSDGQKALAIGVNSLHIVTQVGEGICHFAPDKPTSLAKVSAEALKAGSSVSSAVTDISRVSERVLVRDRGDGWDIAATAFYRTGDALGSLSKDMPKVAEAIVGEDAEKLIKVCQRAGKLAVGKEDLARLPQTARDVGAFILRCTSGRRGGPLAPPAALARPDPAPVAPEGGGRALVPTVAPMTDTQLEGIDTELRDLNGLQEYSAVLSVLLAESTLRDYICPITQKPIRFVVVIEGVETDVYYERRALIAWIRRGAEGHPPGWPADVPVPGSTAEVEANRTVQRIIDRALRTFASQWLS